MHLSRLRRDLEGLARTCAPRSSLTSTSARPRKPTCLSRPEAFGALADAIDGVDRLVLLGDVLEFRDRPFTEAMDLAKPTLAKLGGAQRGRGHRRARQPRLPPDLELAREPRAQRGAPAPPRRESPARPLARIRASRTRCPMRSCDINYPGVWLRKDVYATHGHYLDRHLTIPTFERLGLALVERTLGLTPTGDDPLAPPDEESSDEPEEYERMAAPVFAFLYALAQAGASTNHPGGTPTKRIWDSLTGGGSRSAKVRGWLLGLGRASRRGRRREPPRPRPGARRPLAQRDHARRRRCDERGRRAASRSTRSGSSSATRTGADRFAEEDAWVTKNGATLLNTGSWVHSPSLLRSSSKGSAYWPGTICDDRGRWGPRADPPPRRVDPRGSRRHEPRRAPARLDLPDRPRRGRAGRRDPRALRGSEPARPRAIRRARGRGPRRRRRAGGDRRRDRERAGESRARTASETQKAVNKNIGEITADERVPRGASGSPRSRERGGAWQAGGGREREGRERGRPVADALDETS